TLSSSPGGSLFDNVANAGEGAPPQCSASWNSKCFGDLAPCLVSPIGAIFPSPRRDCFGKLPRALDWCGPRMPPALEGPRDSKKIKHAKNEDRLHHWPGLRSEGEHEETCGRRHERHASQLLAW